MKRQVVLAVGVTACAAVARAAAPTHLYAPSPAFAASDRIVSTTVFHWYSATPHQSQGPWRPLDGIASWSGEKQWWKTQIKQTMAANVDVLYVHLVPFYEQQRVNLFAALQDMRREGYRVPKVAPFLDPDITWAITSPRPNLATTAGKDQFVNEYIRFYQQYYSVNSDAHADQYLHQVDGRMVLNIWHGLKASDNVSSLTRADVESRLQSAFAAQHPAFNNSIYMVIPSTTLLNFYDESIFQYELPDYFLTKTLPGITTAQVKPGYWDENVRSPGTQYKRDGGIHYRDAWQQMHANAAITRVNVESFNEYDEGSGIYPANPGPPYIRPGSAAQSKGSSDVWSLSNDPHEYIRTTAAGAALFNQTPLRDAQIVWHDLPAQMQPGETRTVSVIVRNEGDLSWRGADGYALGQQPAGGSVTLAAPAAIDDAQHEIPTYGGVFHGRPVGLQLQLTAPDQPGTYPTTWSMRQTTQTSGLNNQIAFNWHFNRAGARPGEQAPGLVESIATSSLISTTQNPAAAFGGSGGIEPDNLIFADGGAADNGNMILGDGGERIDFVRFTTRAPVQLAGYRIHLVPDGQVAGAQRAAELIAFSVEGTLVDLFDNNGGSGAIDRFFAGGPVSGDEFLLQLTRTRITGPRIIEIDAILGPDSFMPITQWFGQELSWTIEVVPEPNGGLALLAAGSLAALRRRRCTREV